MKIVSVCRTYPTQRPGGMPFVCQDRAEALARDGQEVHVLTTSHPDRSARENIKGVHVYHLDCPTQKYTKEFAQLCIQKCLELEPDVIHLDSFDRSRPWFAERPGSPDTVAITMHGFGFGSLLSEWNRFRDGLPNRLSFDPEAMKGEAKALARADRVLAISHHEKWLLEDTYALSNVKLVYNPIAPYFFDDTTDPPGDGRYLCAGNPGTSGYRGFDIAEEALSTLPQAELVTAKGDVDRREMASLYDSCDALLLPTYWAQGFDLCVAEALSRRRPVVCSRTGSYYHVAEESDCIVGFPTGDAGALAEILNRGLPRVPESVRTNLHHPDNHVYKWIEAVS